MTDIASLLAMVVQGAREREAATRLPHCIAGAQKRLDEACAALSDRIAELDDKLVAAYRLGWGAGYRCGGDITIRTPTDDELDAQARASLTKEGQASDDLA